jgi:deoxyribodipyrimidine photo-lyase
MVGVRPGPVILWFRRDLRLADNPALDWALASGRSILPVYIHDEALEDRPLGAASRWWLDKSLRALGASLAALGSRLILRAGSAPVVLKALADETRAGALAFNRLHDPAAASRQQAVRAALPGLEIAHFAASWLAEPGTVLTGSGGPYRVFTPFGRALRTNLDLPMLSSPPERIPAPDAWPTSEAVDDWALHPGKPDWSLGFVAWTPGEAGARGRLIDFVDTGLGDYVCGRDAPGQTDGTSSISPHLRFGEIAPWRLAIAVQETARRNPGFDSAADKFVGELAWRDFGAHLLFHFPTMPSANMRPEFDRMPWRDDPSGFEAWTKGATGYPIVDAGMRQLWTTGWMHNRVRMIVASFLVKDLMIDWRRGEAWFWDTLLDADPASNAMNWQWSAGSGVDAAPYFRVFNPALQGERFDAAGTYVRRWVPELAALPERWIHRPDAAPPLLLAEAGVRLGRDYPAPIVDHGAARTRALEAWRTLK